MSRTRITRTSVERLPKSDSQVIYWDTKLIGFGVRCNPDSRSWVVSYRIDSQEHRKTLGRCDRVDIDVAYTQAEAIIRDAAQNISPADRIKLDAPAPVSAPVTLQMIYAEYLVARRHMKDSTAAKYQEHIDRYLSDWLPLRMADITPDMIVAKHAEICTHAPVVADNVIGLVRALMNFAIDMHDGSIIARNPVAKLNKLDGWTNPRPRTSHLADSEIGPWVNACLKLAKDTTRDALLLLIHTGARRDEVLTLRWDNVDLPGETITLIDTKNGLPLTIPVCHYLAEMLQVRRENYPTAEFVFPSRGKTGRMTDLKHPLDNIGAMSGKRVSTHDLRRTFLTICEELDIGVMTRKKLVNHASGDVTSGYTQVSMSKMRKTVEAIADYIRNRQQIVSKNMLETD